jgi:exodeoxyribonuclease VII small subunit
MSEDPRLEARLRRLEEIVAEMEGGEVDLDRGLALFEEGIGHIRSAERLLADAELRIDELIGESGALDTRPIEDADP